MVKRRDLPVLRILLSFLIATFMLLSGFLVGYLVSYLKYQDIARSQESVKYDLLSMDLEREFIELCNISFFDTVSSQLDEMGKSISILEEGFGKNDNLVLDQKKKYTLLEVQHFLIINEYKEKCKENINTIMFFYSNTEEYEGASRRVGNLLDSIKSENSEKNMIYSFDYNLNTNMIKILKRKYNVVKPNTLIINEKYSITEFPTKEEIEKYLI